VSLDGKTLFSVDDLEKLRDQLQAQRGAKEAAG
jgi:hypothetical protein